MRGEYRLDAHRGDQLERLIERQAVALQSGDAVGDAAGLSLGRIVQIFAAAADAMHFFGGVHREEPNRERPRQVRRDGRRPTLCAALQVAVACVHVTFAPLNGREAVSLNEFEQRIAALVAQRFADELPECVHILAQP